LYKIAPHQENSTSPGQNAGNCRLGDRKKIRHVKSTTIYPQQFSFRTTEGIKSRVKLTEGHMDWPADPGSHGTAG